MPHAYGGSDYQIFSELLGTNHKVNCAEFIKSETTPTIQEKQFKPDFNARATPTPITLVDFITGPARSLLFAQLFAQRNAKRLDGANSPPLYEIAT